MRPRLPLVDSLRGFALLIMFVFHFAFDLNVFGAVRIDFHSWFWVFYRTLILVLFLGLLGAGFSLAGRFWPDLLRLLKIAGGACVITVATLMLFPDEWVFFGVLHFILVASLIGPFFTRAPKLCLPLGLALLSVPFVYRSSVFDGTVSQLSGLGTQLPRTIDFVPLCPWLGIVLIGIFCGSLLPREPLPWLLRGEPRLAFLGRHSLLVYLAHQGVLLPLAWVVARALR